MPPGHSYIHAQIRACTDLLLEIGDELTTKRVAQDEPTVPAQHAAGSIERAHLVQHNGIDRIHHHHIHLMKTVSRANQPRTHHIHHKYTHTGTVQGQS